MENYLKFLNKLPKKLRQQLIKTIEKIALNQIQNLDVKCLSKEHQVYRCRVGKLRVLYQGRPDGNYILDIGFRGGIYQKLSKYL